MEERKMSMDEWNNGGKEHQQPEGFKLMHYRCSRGHWEMIWNSRNAVTPFIIGCRFCTEEAEHVNWNQDEYLPDHKPAAGTRVFIDLTIEKARKYRRDFVAKWWNTPSTCGSESTMENSGMYKSEKDAVEKLAKHDMDSFAPHTPTLVIVGVDIPAP